MVQIRESGEDYLETILILKQRKDKVFSVDIANELGYSKPSVSRAMGILKGEGYITMDDDNSIHFTNKGRAAASSVYERHRYISLYLQKALGVSAEIAAEDACRIEHIISTESFESMKSWLADN